MNFKKAVYDAIKNNKSNDATGNLFDFIANNYPMAKPYELADVIKELSYVCYSYFGTYGDAETFNKELLQDLEEQWGEELEEDC